MIRNKGKIRIRNLSDKKYIRVTLGKNIKRRILLNERKNDS